MFWRYNGYIFQVRFEEASNPIIIIGYLNIHTTFLIIITAVCYIYASRIVCTYDDYYVLFIYYIL